jgi:hypothetical protein
VKQEKPMRMLGVVKVRSFSLLHEGVAGILKG